MPGDQFAEDIAKIGGEREIAAFVELLVLKTRPLAVDFAAAHIAAQNEHDIGVAMVGSAIAVFFRGAAELGHGDQRDVCHAIAQVLMESRERLAKLRQVIRKLSRSGLAAHFVHVRVPAADVGEGHFQADVGLDQPRDLLQTFAKPAIRILQRRWRARKPASESTA